MSENNIEQQEYDYWKEEFSRAVEKNKYENIFKFTTHEGAIAALENASLKLLTQMTTIIFLNIALKILI